MNMHFYRTYPVVQALLAYELIDDDCSASENISVTCPFLDHEDSSPSFSIHATSGLWNCFGCYRKGNYDQLIRMLEEQRLGREIDDLELVCKKIDIEQGIDFEETFVTSIQKAVKKSKRDERAIFLAQEFFYTLKKPHWNVIQYHYLQVERQFSVTTLVDFDIRLNYNSEFSIIIPIYQQGVFQGYTSRKAHKCTDKETKYWHSPGLKKSEIVFGNLSSGPVLIVEGPFDMMKAWQYGYTNVCCIFGWHISDIQVNHIKQYATEVISGLDNDERGDEGSLKLQEQFSDRPFYQIRFPQSKKDICELQQQEFHLSITKKENQNGYGSIRRDRSVSRIKVA